MPTTPTRLADALREVERLRAEVEALKKKLNAFNGAIPAYTPQPCDCITKVDWGYRVECECGCIDSACEAARWAEKTAIIDRYDDINGEVK